MTITQPLGILGCHQMFMKLRWNR